MSESKETDDRTKAPKQQTFADVSPEWVEHRKNGFPFSFESTDGEGVAVKKVVTLTPERVDLNDMNFFSAIGKFNKAVSKSSTIKTEPHAVRGHILQLALGNAPRSQAIYKLVTGIDASWEVVREDIEKQLKRKDTPHCISKFVLHLACIAFRLDLVIINASEPIQIYRPRQEALTDTTVVDWYRKAGEGVRCYLFRHQPGRPLYYDARHSTDFLAQDYSHFALLLDSKKEIPVESLPVDLDLAHLAAIQTYQTNCILRSSFNTEEEAKKYYYSSGRQRESLKRKRSSAKKADVYEYFEEQTVGSVTRLHCKVEGCPDNNASGWSTGSSTDTLRTHLQTKHSLLVESANSETVDLTSDTSVQAAKTSTSSLVNNKLGFKPIEKAKRRAFNSKIDDPSPAINAVIDSGLGYRLVDSDWFKTYTAEISDYVLPSRTTIQRLIKAMGPGFYSNRAKYFLKLVSKASITFDGWTDSLMRAFYYLTLHWIDDDFVMFSITLEVVQVEGGEGLSERLAEAMLQLIFENNLYEKIFASTCDNAPDAIATANIIRTKVGSYRTRCTGHIIQLGAVAAFVFLEQELRKLRELVKAIKNSKNKRKRFRQLSELFKLETREPPTLDTPIKWGSTFEFVNQSLNKRDVVDKICRIDDKGFRDLHSYKLGDDEWSKVTQIRDFLAAFCEWKNDLEPEKKPTLCKVLGVFQTGMKKCKKIINRATSPSFLVGAASAMLKCLEEYWNDCETEQAKMAVFLDPTVPVEIRREYAPLVLSELELSYGYKKPSGVSCEVRKVAKKVNSLYCNSDSDDDCDGQEAVDVSNAGRKTIIDEYLDLGVEDVEGFCLLAYWRKTKTKWPELWLLARTVLAAQATSCSSERSASAGKYLLAARETLSEDNFVLETLLRSWRKTGIDLKEYESDKEDEVKSPVKKATKIN